MKIRTDCRSVFAHLAALAHGSIEERVFPRHIQTPTGDTDICTQWRERYREIGERERDTQREREIQRERERETK